MYIANQESLEAFVERARSSSVLAIDTEFLREKTYYAKLCLLQLATDDEAVIVDPFEVDDLGVLEPLLADEGIVKLFHAGGQDLEIILREVGVIPRPVFDTQVAAALLGYTQQIGYAALWCTPNAACRSRRSTRSPTGPAARFRTSQLRIRGRRRGVPAAACTASMRGDAGREGAPVTGSTTTSRRMCDPARYAPRERERFRRLKRASQLSRRQLSAAREFACLARGRGAAARRAAQVDRSPTSRWWRRASREARTIDELFMVRGMREQPVHEGRAHRGAALMAKGSR